MSKSIVCACEDVTDEDVKTAVAKGYCDLESVKRYTGFGTGFCQGKNCLNQVAQTLHAATKLPPNALAPFTPRPPLYPTELGALASISERDVPPTPLGVPASIRFSPPALKPEGDIPARAKIVIVGGGIMGLALAHNLALRGETDVVVLERGYLCSGASGRNGGGVRMQWGTQNNIELARRSIQLMETFARDMGINIWLRQGGYLFLAKHAQTVKRMERNAKLHHALGVETEILTPEAARELVPQLTLKGILACSYHPKDGVIFPWPFLWGYAQSCAKRGIKIETFTNVTGFDMSQGAIRAVKTDRGTIACDTVVLACGAWSADVAKLAGVALPNQPHRHEILSTEPLKPFLEPLVSVLDTGLYFSQSLRGEIVGGMGDASDPGALNLGSTFRFLSRFAKAITEQMPILGSVKVLRQWAGPYDVTPDNNPILGRTPGLSNLLQMSGFVGHGFMMAPAVAERMAKWMATGNSDELFERYTLNRFASGELQREDMIIG